MCKINVKVVCPHCRAMKVNKNNHKSSGIQNFLCEECKEQFQNTYIYRGAAPEIKHLIVNMLLRNSRIRDIETVPCVSRHSVLNTLSMKSKKCEIKPKSRHYKSAQIDEYCTDDWRSFSAVFREENHRIGKDLTVHIEGVNNGLRVRNRRFVRKTTCFSKKDEHHEAAIKIMFQQRNYKYHIF